MILLSRTMILEEARRKRNSVEEKDNRKWWDGYIQCLLDFRVVREWKCETCVSYPDRCSEKNIKFHTGRGTVCSQYIQKYYNSEENVNNEN